MISAFGCKSLPFVGMMSVGQADTTTITLSFALNVMACPRPTFGGPIFRGVAGRRAAHGA